MPLERLVFFLDRSIGKTIVAELLRRAGAIVEVHADHFPPASPDEEWLTEAGRRGWIAITRDKRIRHREIERVALQHSRVKAFVVTTARISGSELGLLLVTRLGEMVRIVDENDGPFIALISREGVRMTRT